MLPPSAVQTSAEDDLDRAANGGAGGSTNNNSSSRRNSLTPAGSSTTGPLSMRRISSLPPGIGSRTATAAVPGAGALDAAGQGSQQQQQMMLRRSSTDLHDPAHENPLNVVLAARAGQIGDNPEAIRQRLLAMKLASGALHFNNAVSTFAASLAGSASCEQVVSRFTSFSSAMPPSSRNSISSRPGVAPAPAAAAATLSLEARDAGAEAATAAAAAGSSGGGAEPSPFSSQQQQLAGTPSLSPSPSLFNITAANVMAHQSSQSLQRLLSGNTRIRRAASAAVGVQHSGSVPSPSGLSMAAGLPGAFSSHNSSPAAAATATAAGGRGAVTNGDLPIVQQQPGAAAAAVIFSDDGDDEEGTCEICFDAAAVVALERCGHTLCVGCCKELCKLHHFKPGLCPYCRCVTLSQSVCVDEHR